MRHTVLKIVLLAGACLLAFLLWPDADPVVRTDRIHDLIALMADAEFTGESPYAERKAATIDANDPRDRLAYLRMPTGTSVVFTDLVTSGPARLQFGCGVAWTRDEITGEAVVFRIEEKTGSDGDFETVFEVSLDHGQLPEPSRLQEFEVVLPGRDLLSRSLRFSTKREDGGSADASWPGWFHPTLTSTGRDVPLSEWNIPVTDVALDMAATLDQAEILDEDERIPIIRTSLDAAEGIPSAGGPRQCIRVSAPSRIRFEMTVPKKAKLLFAIGMDTDLGWKKPGDGMTFAVAVKGETIWSRFLNASQVEADRGWKEVQIDLEAFGGQQVDIELLTTPGDDETNDVGGFANPLVITEHDVPRKRTDEAPTVVVVLVDTLRSDHVGPDSDNTTKTPNLNRSAEQGISFRNAQSVSSWTWPAVASIFTGLYPHGHGVHSGSGFYLADSMDTLAEQFQKAGYTTGAFVSNLLIGQPDNFDQGFETYVHAPYLRARAVNERVFNWFDRTDGLARFAYVHYFDPHGPYLPPESWHPEEERTPAGEELLQKIFKSHSAGQVDEEAVKEWMTIQRRLYDAEVRYFDEAFGELIEGLRSRGILDNCLLVFVSDHGEEFYEHGLVDHGGNLNRETVRVPLWITGYGKSALTAHTVDEPVETRSIFPSILAMAGLKTPDPKQMPEALIQKGLPHAIPDAIFGQTGQGVEDGVDGRVVKIFVIRNGFKLIHTPTTGRTSLFHLKSDAAEERDCLDEHPREAEALLSEVMAWYESSRPGPAGIRSEAGDDALEKMRELGYTGD